MTTFHWLLIGHLLGDWLFQNDWMARGKQQHLFTLACTTHVIIYTVMIVGALYLSGAAGSGFLLNAALAATVFISHWLIDATDAAGHWTRFYRQSNHSFVRIMVDQTFHLLVLAGLTLALPPT